MIVILVEIFYFLQMLFNFWIHFHRKKKLQHSKVDIFLIFMQTQVTSLIVAEIDTSIERALKIKRIVKSYSFLNLNGRGHAFSASIWIGLVLFLSLMLSRASIRFGFLVLLLLLLTLELLIMFTASYWKLCLCAPERRWTLCGIIYDLHRNLSLLT